jgi:serine/threonine-protein kinase
MVMRGEPRSPGARAPAIGDLLGGKYRVERVLGEGAMGVVVAAMHLELDQPVAIKLVRAAIADDAVVAERFLREARAVAKLKSPHVARVIDVDRLESGLPYLVMEYLDGADLAKVLAVEGPPPVRTACAYVEQACDALGEAHALGIVHRDIKPENLFLARSVGESLIVKVLDFGVSKQATVLAQALTTAHELVGSPLYMAPELLRSSGSADARSDVWALGVVLYELLTGRLPYEADSLADLCLKVVREDPQPINGLRADLPPRLAHVVHRCLAKDPSKRYPNAAELAAALAGFAAGPSSERTRSRLAVSGPSPALQALARTMSTRALRLRASSGARRRWWMAAGPAIALAAWALVTSDHGNTAAQASVFGGVRAALGASPPANLQSPLPAALQSVAAAPASALAAPAQLSPAPVQHLGAGPPRPRPAPHGAPPLAAVARPPDDDIPAFR